MKSNKVFFGTRFIIIFSVIFSLFFATLFLHRHAEVQIDLNQIKSEQHSLVLMQKRYITSTLDIIGKSVLLLSDLAEINDLHAGLNRKQLEAEAMAFSLRSSGMYDQIRYIDMKGNEVVRINNKSGQPFSVPKHQLQNKIDRYYVQESLHLNEGDIYISPLDLNIEHGEIEKPYKPMLRIATPIISPTGKRKGIIIVNYLAKHLLDGVRGLTFNNQNHQMLINSKGYFLLYDKRPELEFAFMFPNSEQYKYSSIYPATYETVSTQLEGQYELANGLLTINTIPISSILRQSKQPINIIGKECCWRLVTFVRNTPKVTLYSIINTEPLLFWVMVILALALTATITQLQLKKRINHKEIKQLAHHDSLTGLLNRGYFKQLFHWKMQIAKKNNSKLAFIYIDMDGFKQLNDTYGHSIGDLALRTVSLNLTTSFARNSYIARIGGDEFAVLIYDVDHIDNVLLQAKAFIALSKSPLLLDDQLHILSSSIGISIFPDHGSNINEIMHNADIAMYKIKHSGKNGIRVFSPE